MPHAYLGLGSNKGHRLEFLRHAIMELRRVPETRVVGTSGVYETEPYGVKDQADFLHAVVEVETNLSPEGLADELKNIEQIVGEKAAVRWGPREIDIDLLFFDGEILKTPSLVVPHPEAAKRRFVLVPLADLVPEFRDPATGQTVADLLSRCPDTGQVKKTSMNLGAG